MERPEPRERSGDSLGVDSAPAFRPSRPAAGRQGRGGAVLAELPVNLVGFAALTVWLVARGSTQTAVSLVLVLGVFSIWTETALLERRLDLVGRLLGRKVRADDPAPFVGALIGAIAAGLAGLTRPENRALALPLAMWAGALCAGTLRGLDWRRGLLGAILVVYNGAGGRILRVSLTLCVWGLVLTGAGP